MSHSTSNPPSRTSTPAKFTQPSETLEDALKTQTVGLVNLRDFQKRRVELAEQRDREAAESKLPSAAGSAGSRSGQASREASAGPSGGEGKQGNKKKKRKLAVAKGKLSFGGEDEEDGNADGDGESSSGEMKRKSRSVTAERKGPATDDQQEDISTAAAADTGTGNNNTERKRKFNPKLKAPPPKALTKSTLLREAQEREMLRREFLQLQEKIKNEDITIPFVFYDGECLL